MQVSESLSHQSLSDGDVPAPRPQISPRRLGLHLPLPRRRSPGPCSLASWESRREVAGVTVAPELREPRSVPEVGPGLSSRRRPRRRSPSYHPRAGPGDGTAQAGATPREHPRAFPGRAHPYSVALKDPRLPCSCAAKVDLNQSRDKHLTWSQGLDTVFSYLSRNGKLRPRRLVFGLQIPPQKPGIILQKYQISGWECAMLGLATFFC